MHFILVHRLLKNETRCFKVIEILKSEVAKILRKDYSLYVNILLKQILCKNIKVFEYKKVFLFSALVDEAWR